MEWGSDETETGGAAITRMSLNPLDVIDHYPGPALLVTPGAKPLRNNEAGSALGEGLLTGTVRDETGQPLAPTLKQIAASGHPAHLRLLLPVPGDKDIGTKAYEANAIPVNDDDKHARILLLCTPITLEKNLRSALAESRNFYQDLARCSNEFAWATDEYGRFCYVSPHGAMGYPADVLLGREAMSLGTLERLRETAASVFMARNPISDQELWLEAKNGKYRCLLLSSVPVIDVSGAWRGARGVGRDVTQLRLREYELGQMRRSEEKLESLLSAMHGEIESDAKVRAGGRALVKSLNLTAAVIFKKDTEGDCVFDIKNAIPICGDSTASLPASFLLGDNFANWGKHLLSYDPGKLVEIKQGDLSGLLVTTLHQGDVNGAVCLIRQNDADKEQMENPLHGKSSWRRDNRRLIRAFAVEVGQTLAQASYQDRLEYLSQTDELTGLLNRRAFMREANRRLSHHRRAGRKAALFYAGLDNFKQINDLLGHKAGDDLLADIGACLSRHLRASDLPARFGGDEFGIWFEELNEAAAELRVMDLLEAMGLLFDAFAPQLAEKSGDDERAETAAPLGCSVGLAIYDPETEEQLSELVSRADSALNRLKHEGKGGFRIAGPFTATGNTGNSNSAQKS